MLFYNLIKNKLNITQVPIHVISVACIIVSWLHGILLKGIYNFLTNYI